MWKVCWNKGRLCWKIAKLFYFCHLKKLVRPEIFGPYHLCFFCKVYVFNFKGWFSGEHTKENACFFGMWSSLVDIYGHTFCLILEEGGYNENKLRNLKTGWRHTPAAILVNFTVADMRTSNLKMCSVQFELAEFCKRLKRISPTNLSICLYEQQ